MIPLNNFWWLSPSPHPHVFIFHVNFTGPPSYESFKSFQRSPLLGSQLPLIPPIRSPKTQVIPPLKSFPRPASRKAINNDRSLFMYDPFLTLIFIMIFIFVITIIILILFLGQQKQRKVMVAETTSQEGVKPGEETRIIVPLPVPSLPPTTMGCSCIKVSYFLRVIYSFSVRI